ncbi:tRNA endonuclease ANKZF1-like isoform X2 [Rhodnius prolixus]|uniref:tRNA endonuclease ANKZF1-like isoform X2 n=1 Tax=Rhodnius prolixus TaxID=13249 RepID=UPI003D18C3D1
METKTCFIYQVNEFISLLDNIRVSQFMKSKQTTEPPVLVPDPNVIVPLDDLYISDTLYCSYCNCGFLDKNQQRAHYKLDWHRYNLKQHLSQKRTVTEDKFAQIVENDLSSISGSESESEDDTDQTETESAKEAERLSHLIARRSRILFNNSSGKVISVHRCLLLHKKEEASSDERLIELLTKLPYRTNWLIIMLGGGHFAAAIFKGNEPILHKTFHSYIVRAKQGSSQSSKDNKGTHARSAGASLRRYNEQSFAQHIQELMKNWGADIVKCDLIFYRALGRLNNGLLFSGTNAPLLKSDPRLRTIPFPTRRATFNEVKRVHSLLATAFVYDSNEIFKSTFSPPKSVKDDVEEKKWAKKPSENGEQTVGSPKKIDRAKERPSPVRELPDIVQQLASISTSESEGDLKEFDDTVPQSVKDQVRKKTKKKKKENFQEKEPVREELKQYWNAVHGACETGDEKQLEAALQKTEGITADEIYLVLNERNINGETILHKLASEGKGSTIRLLLLHGADPTVKDKKSQTAYDHAVDKLTRNIFRRFMGEYPDKFDYTKSHIPSALNDEIEAEIADKRKAARKAKRLKEKEKKTEKEAVKKEEEEKQRFLHLSDREKRALAAERRLLAAGGQKNVVLSRCFTCATDITAKVPFEYENFRFCSMDCLKAHRIQSKKL